jgi:predicted dehydrogenase
MATKVKRRDFLRRGVAAAIAAPTIIPAHVLGREGATPPSEQITVASLGMGFAWEMGAHNPNTRLLAVCDVQKGRRDAAKEAVDKQAGNRDCKAYNDFRDVIARDDIDAVYIASPDHWHALMTIAAARAGKHIYCQKPLTHTVGEGQAVIEAVRRHGVVLQHGTQHRSEWAFSSARELIKGGYIGKLHTVRLGTPSGTQLPPQPVQPVPEGFDYDLWLGPARWAPFTSRRCFGMHSWYFISDYCVGYIAGWGVHHLDSGQHGMGADNTGPTMVRAKAIFPTEGLYDTPIHYRVDYEYANGVKMICTDVPGDTWSQGARINPARVREIHGDAYGKHEFGVKFEGTEGSIFAWRGARLDTEPAEIRQLVEHDAPRGGAPNTTMDHFQNWIDCIRSRKEPNAPVEVGHRSTTLCNIGTIAMQLGRDLRWDPVKEIFPDDAEANRLLSTPYRAPWHI